MKRTITLLLLFFALLSVSAKVKITRIDPTDWYVGMKDPTLQLMVYGEGIRDAEVSTDYPHARIDSLVRLDSPNYLLVYMNLEGAQPGEMRLQFKLNGSKLTERYVLHARAKAAEDHKGFSQADVLYLLMPDRFANGDTGNDVVKGMRDGLCDHRLLPRRSALWHQCRLLRLDPRLPRARTEGRHGHDLQPLQQLPSLAAGQPVP